MKINELNEVGAPHLPAPRGAHLPAVVKPAPVGAEFRAPDPRTSTKPNTTKPAPDVTDVPYRDTKTKAAEPMASDKKGMSNTQKAAAVAVPLAVVGTGAYMAGAGRGKVNPPAVTPNTQPATTTDSGPMKPAPGTKQQNLNYKGSEGSQSLMALNPDKIKNVNQIKAGDSIDLGGGNMYKIQKGDTLDKIAQRMTRPSGQPRAELDKPDSVLPGPSAEKPPAPEPVTPVTPVTPAKPPETSMDDSNDANASTFTNPNTSMDDSNDANASAFVNPAVSQTNNDILTALRNKPPTQAATTTPTPTPEPVKGTPENPYDKGPEVKSSVSGETWKDREGNAVRTRSDAEIGDTNRAGVVVPGSYDARMAAGEKNMQRLKDVGNKIKGWFNESTEELNRIRKLSGMPELMEAGMPAYMKKPAPTPATAPTTATNASSLRTMQNQAGTQIGTTGPAATVGQPASSGSAKVTPQVAPAQSAMNQVKPPAANPAVTSAGASGPPGSFQRGDGIRAATAALPKPASTPAVTSAGASGPPGSFQRGAGIQAATVGGGRGGQGGPTAAQMASVNKTTQAATTAPAAKPQPQGPAVGSQAQTAGGANELAKTGIMGGQPAPAAAPANPGTQAAGIGFNQDNLGTRAPATQATSGSPMAGVNYKKDVAFGQGNTSQATSGSPMAGVNYKKDVAFGQGNTSQSTQAATTSTAGSGVANNTTTAPQVAPAQSAMNQASNTQAATTSGSPLSGIKSGMAAPLGRDGKPMQEVPYDADMAEFQRDKADMLGKGAPPNQGGPETQAIRDFEESIMRESTMELNQLRKFSGLPELTESEVTVHKGTYGNSYGKEDVRDQYGHKIGKVDKGSEAKKDAPKRGRGRPTKGDKDEHGNDTKFDTSGLQGMLGSKAKGEVGKKSVKHSLKDWMEVVSDNMINESEIDGDKEEPMKKAIGDKKEPAKTSNAFTQTAPYPSFKKKNPLAKKVKETKDLPGKQDNLDVAEPKGKLTKADFEALRKKKKVSEARVMEESEYTYEKVGKTLAQENPTLASDSDEFANAVYHEMIQMGMTPKSAHYKLNHDPDFLGEVVTAFHHYLGQGTVDEGAGAGRGSVNPPVVNPNTPAPAARTASPGWGKDDYKPLVPDNSKTFKPAVSDPEGVKEAGSFIRNLASSRRAFEGKDMKDVQLESWDKELDSLLNENLTISTTIDDQGHDSVNVSATEGNAHEIIELLRNAGLGGLGGAKQEHGQEVNNYGLPMSGDEHQGPEAQLIAVGDPHSHDSMGDEGGDDMMALIKKMTGIEDSGEQGHEEHGGQDYESEEGHNEHNHEDGECEECGQSPCECDDEHEEVDEAEMEEGNMFTGNLAKARAQGKEHADLDGDGDMEKVDEGHDTCNECGGMMYEGHSCGSEQLEEYANDADDTADQDIAYMMRTLSGGGGMGEKRSQATAPIIKIVTAEGTLMRDSTDLLSDFRKLSGI